MLNLIQGLSDAGSDVNEDMLWLWGHDAALLDGASSLGSDDHDAVEFVTEFLGRYAEATANRRRPLHECINAALDAVREEFDFRHYASGMPPSASAVFVRSQKGMLCLALIGDCTAIAYGRDGTTRRFHDGEVGRFDAEVIATARHISERDGICLREAISTAEVRERLVANRHMMNKDGGYRILAANMRPVEEMDILRIPEEGLDALLLHSDGFDAMGERLLRRSFDLAGLCAELREVERTDRDFSLMPRFKPHDDASALLLGVGEEQSRGE